MCLDVWQSESYLHTIGTWFLASETINPTLKHVCVRGLKSPKTTTITWNRLKCSEIYVKYSRPCHKQHCAISCWSPKYFCQGCRIYLPIFKKIQSISPFFQETIHNNITLKQRNKYCQWSHTNTLKKKDKYVVQL